MILGEVKARPKDIISFSLDYISKSKVQTSNPSSSPTPLDTPARPADFTVLSDASVMSLVGCLLHACMSLHTRTPRQRRYAGRGVRQVCVCGTWSEAARCNKGLCQGV